MSSDATYGLTGADAAPPTTPDTLEPDAPTGSALPVARRAALLTRRVEVRALRAAVAQERRRRQQIVDQYETLLDDRSTEPGTAEEPGRLGGLLDRVGRLTPGRR